MKPFILHRNGDVSLRSDGTFLGRIEDRSQVDGFYYAYGPDGWYVESCSRRWRAGNALLNAYTERNQP